MKLLNFYADGGVHLGLRLAGGVLDVTALGDGLPHNTDEAISAGLGCLRRLSALTGEGQALLREEDLRFAPAVIRPNLILCVGLNYHAHIREIGEDSKPLPTHPVWFNKFSGSLLGHRGQVTLCRASGQHDAEAEIVVVIGKGGRYIKKEAAREHIFGYTLGNDISARDLQFRSQQWLIGKAADTFGPLGPWIVTRDQIDEARLNIQGSINGQLRQNSDISRMIFDIPTLIADVSQFFTLSPGDVIYTGTCEGVILGRKPPLTQDWLKAGDLVSVSSDQIGVLTNSIVAG
ncbi:MAG: fumarylacetoacetate hydrolase family protein [Christensenellales bacterium]